jgi:hypothetical protein
VKSAGSYEATGEEIINKKPGSESRAFLLFIRVEIHVINNSSIK